MVFENHSFHGKKGLPDPLVQSHPCIELLHNPGSQPAILLPLYQRSDPSLFFILERMQQITDWFRRERGKKEIFRIAAGACLQEILLFLSSRPFPTGNASPMGKSSLALKHLVEWIDEHLSCPLTITELTQEAGLSQNYMSRLFRFQYGMTIQRYILLRRIEVARHLLQTSKCRIKDVGVQVGFPNAQHFNKKFRQVAGFSPSEFQRAEENRKPRRNVKSLLISK